jgi:hypothetical protein
VLENSCDDLGLGDEGQDAKSAATGTEEWVGFVNSADQIGPTLSEGGTMFGSQLGLVGFCIAAISRSRFPIETAVFSQSTGPRGIGPVVVDILNPPRRGAKARFIPGRSLLEQRRSAAVLFAGMAGVLNLARATPDQVQRLAILDAGREFCAGRP